MAMASTDLQLLEDELRRYFAHQRAARAYQVARHHMARAGQYAARPPADSAAERALGYIEDLGHRLSAGQKFVETTSAFRRTLTAGEDYLVCELYDVGRPIDGVRFNLGLSREEIRALRLSILERLAAWLGQTD